VKQIFIKEAGHFIHLYGHGPVRTPIRFNVKEKRLDSIIRELNSIGIQYEIIDGEDSASITVGKVPDSKKMVESVVDMKWLSKMISKIVSEAISSDPTIKSINQKIERLLKYDKIMKEPEFESEYKEVKKKKKIEKDEEFIPTIKVDDMTIQSRGSFRVEQADKDLEQAADQLKKVIK